MRHHEERNWGNTNNRAGTADKYKRIPYTIRFRKTEWNRIESLAKSRRLSPSEFVRYAELAAVSDNNARSELQADTTRSGAAIRPIPRILEKHLTLFRSVHNFIFVGADGKMPAMRLGFARRPLTFEDILWHGQRIPRQKRRDAMDGRSQPDMIPFLQFSWWAQFQGKDHNPCKLTRLTRLTRV